MSVRAKFRCDGINKSLSGRDEITTIVLNPVYSNDPNSENAQFWKYTPQGRVELGTINIEAAKRFELGKEYYVDFTPAE